MSKRKYIVTNATEKQVKVFEVPSMRLLRIVTCTTGTINSTPIVDDDKFTISVTEGGVAYIKTFNSYSGSCVNTIRV